MATIPSKSLTLTAMQSIIDNASNKGWATVCIGIDQGKIYIGKDQVAKPGPRELDGMELVENGEPIQL